MLFFKYNKSLYKFCNFTIQFPHLNLCPVHCVKASMNYFNQSRNANLFSIQSQLLLEAQDMEYPNKCVLCERTGSTVPLLPPTTGSKSLPVDSDINNHTLSVQIRKCMAVNVVGRTTKSSVKHMNPILSCVHSLLKQCIGHALF